MMNKEDMIRVVDDALGEAVTDFHMGVAYDDARQLAKLIVDRIDLARGIDEAGGTP